jgi:ABC-type transport system involved in multi-copper enzyme maturation permease subunit
MTTPAVKRKRLRRWGLPLLTKELAEQSARKRTYVIRTVYACLLAGFALLIFWAEVYNEINSPFEVLGQGREMFQVILALQFAGVYLFMPAITCAVITTEKERNTIGLLLLTKLGPWTILLEKYLGRLVPMGTFLLLALPLMGFTYAMGGVTQQEMWVSLWALFITVLQVGALALACSSFFRTTVASFIATYVIGFLLFFGPVFLQEMFPPVADLSDVAGDMYCGAANAAAQTVADAWNQMTGHGDAVGQPIETLDFYNEEFALLQCAPVMLIDRWDMPLWQVVPRSLGVLLSIPFWLIVARVFVVRRAFVPSRNWLLGIFKRLDGLFHRMNENRLTKGIVVINDSASLPGDEPIAWRETKKKSLGTTRYLIRIFVATEFPAFAICLLLSIGRGFDYRYRNESEAISAVLFIAWVLIALLISVKASSLISSERSHETLDVLLSTPMRCSDLVRQKFRGIRRLMLVLAMPLLTVIIFQTLWRQATQGFLQVFDEHSTLLYVISSVLSVVVYLPMIAWVSFYIGLRVRSQVKAIFASLAVIVAWCAIPVFALVIFDEIFQIHFWRNTPLSYLFLLSPASIIPFTEFSALDEFHSSPWLAMFFNYAYYGAILLIMRWACLDGAPWFLGRGERRRVPFDLRISRRPEEQRPAQQRSVPPGVRS